MGYRIGYQCFVNSEAAHDYLLSQQPPTITADGLLIRPVKQGQDWYLNGSKIQLSFPQCSIDTQVKEGVMLSAPLILLAALVFGFGQVKRLIQGMSDTGDVDD